MINVLEQYIAKPDDPVHNLSVELSRELQTTFGYVLDPDHAEFCPEFVTATYLTPHFKFLIKPELKTVVVRYLKGKFIVYRIKFQTKSFYKGMVTCREGSTTAKKRATEYCLDGYEGLQSEFSSSVNASSDAKGKFILCKVLNILYRG